MHLQSKGDHVQKHCRARAHQRNTSSFCFTLLTMSMLYPSRIRRLQYDRLVRTLHIRIDRHDSVHYRVEHIRLYQACHLHGESCRFSNEICHLKEKTKKCNLNRSFITREREKERKVSS